MEDRPIRRTKINRRPNQRPQGIYQSAPRLGKTLSLIVFGDTAGQRGATKTKNTKRRESK